MQFRIDELSQTNQLQLGLADRLTLDSLTQLRLVSGESVNGKVIGIGIDAVLIQTSLTIDLVPISSLTSVLKLAKAKRLDPVRNILFLPTLIKCIESNIIIHCHSGEIYSGQLLSVWSDCFDLIGDTGLVTFPISSVLKLSLSHA